MQVKYLKLIILFLIIFFGAYLRLINLDKNPNGFYVDEAAIGFNAYSLLQTGQDEYGKSFPIFLRSFGAYSSTFYTYITIPFVALFGLEITSVRIVSALSGIISIFLIFLILKQLNLFRSSLIPFMGSFLFATSPWSIFFSRGAFEANLAFAIVLGSIWMFLMARKKEIFLIPAALLLAISTYAYQAERLIAFVFLTGFILFFIKIKRELLGNKIPFIALVLFIVIQLPQFSVLTTPAFSLRQSGLFYGEQIKNQAINLEPLPYFLTLPLSFFREFFAQALSYLSPKNLFFQPDSDLQRSLPELSVFYSWMVIPYLVGLFILAQKWKDKEIKLVILILVSFILPAALTRDPFSTLRSLPLVLALLIIICLGFDQFLKSNLRLTLCLFFIFMVISLISLYRSSAVLLPNERAREWGFGFSDLANEIKKRPNEKFLVDTGRMKPAYIELAFFLKFPPQLFQQSVDPNIKANYYYNTKWNDHYLIGQVETRAIDFKKDIYQDQILVGDELAISEEQAKEHFLTKVFEIKSPADEVIFQGFRTNPKLKCESNLAINECRKI